MNNNLKQKESIIIGIDPGFTCTGYAVIKKEGSKLSLLDLGGLSLNPKEPLWIRIKLFYEFINKKIDQYNITDIALETPFLGKNAQNFLKLGYLRGNLYLIAGQKGLVLHEFSPKLIKLSVTGSGNADKEQVARVVTRLFLGVNIPDKLDITDALAIALCGAWQIPKISK